MRKVALLGVLAAVAAAGDRIDEIAWLSSKEAFKRAKDEKTARWVLVYKEWPK